MSGTPQKMLEHLLETRLGGQVGPNDPFLDDFLLTHIVFMPVPMLIDELANLYPFQITIFMFQLKDLLRKIRHLPVHSSYTKILKSMQNF